MMAPLVNPHPEFGMGHTAALFLVVVRRVSNIEARARTSLLAIFELTCPNHDSNPSPKRRKKTRYNQENASLQITHVFHLWRRFLHRTATKKLLHIMDKHFKILIVLNLRSFVFLNVLFVEALLLILSL
jgi:hypothetical protein